jgi:predicted metal-dependent hydrolase
MRRLTVNTPAGWLEYTVTHRARVTKRLHMELGEHGGLVVVAPRHWSKRHIHDTLAQNTGRVERFLANARQRQLRPLQYIQGSLHLYLGSRYPLNIRPAVGRKASVVFTGQQIHIETIHRVEKDISAALQAWYCQQANMICSERLQLIASRAVWAGSRAIPLKLRRMKRTWGNCSSNGLIKLNTHLIKAPLPVIDSVIAHELCHLEEMNHGPAFYGLLESLNPNWRGDRARLRSEGNIYLQS